MYTPTTKPLTNYHFMLWYGLNLPDGITIERIAEKTVPSDVFLSGAELKTMRDAWITELSERLVQQNPGSTFYYTRSEVGEIDTSITRNTTDEV